jgi:hypothetical protein
MPNVIEAKLVPVALFLVLLEFAGTRVALVGALAWSLLALARRRRQGRRTSGLLVLTTVGLAARTFAALLTGSLVIYFIQPTVATALVGLSFLGSVVVGRPLVERLILDVCPMDEATRCHPTLRRFFAHVSLWWAFTSMVNFGITLWLLLYHSPATFLLVKSMLGPLTTTITLSVAYLWFRNLVARSGAVVVLAEHPPTRRVG